MNNQQNLTNFFVRVYGNTVKDISGKDIFECSIADMPTPAISVGTATYSTHPLKQRANKSTTGRVASNTFNNTDTISFKFLVDEDFESYLFFVKLMSTVVPANRKLPANVDDTNFIELVATDNQKQPLIVFKYNKFHPTRISSIAYDSQLNAPNTMVASVEIEFDSFNITDRHGNEII